MRFRAFAYPALEVVGGVAVAIALVAVLDGVAPIDGLSVVPLLVVLAVSVRRGQLAGLAAAVLSVLALNFFFLAPRYQLTIANSENVATLIVFLIAAVVVGRLAALARTRAQEAEARAREAAAREREAEMLAAVAGRLLSGASLKAELAWIADHVAAALDAGSVRFELAPAPAPRPGEQTVRLPLRNGHGWLHATGADPQRVVEPLARLMDVAFERDRLRNQAADAEASRRADIAKTAILHAISHDLRSPLTAITTAADALAQDATDPADRRELVSAVRDEAARLARLVSDILDLSKIQAGAVNPREDWVDLGEVVARAADGVRADHPGEAVILDVPADLPLVRADAAQLERVFSNLLDNAVKFSPPGQPVQVRGTAGAGRVTVRVVDRGPGIPTTQRGSIFEPFFRGRPSRGGAGLGLAIARGFVEANGGRIAVASAAPGDETAFAVSLPRAEPPQSP